MGLLHRYIITILLLGLTLVAQASSSVDTHEFMLDNGLKLIVKEDHRAPIVVSQVWYKVGSSYEHNGITGVSHVLEHMMFKGTHKFPAGEFSRIISKNGGRENAFTGRDYTAYFQQLEKSRLAVSFELEADRMTGLKLTQEEFEKEINVVMEERRLRTDDDPMAQTYEQFNAAAFINNPYHNPIIGWMNDLENMQLDDLKDWYQRWYQPNNATIVIAGDVEPKAVLTLAQRYFGHLKATPVKAIKPRKEKPQQGLRRITVKAPAELPYLMMGYKTPAITTADAPWKPYALEVLAGILDGGSSARLAKYLIRESKIAVNAGASYDGTTRQSSLLMLDGTPAKDQDIATLEQALKSQIERLRDTLVTPEELTRIKSQVISSAVYEQDSAFYQAMKIGVLETIGLNWQLDQAYVDNIRAISAEQVQAVAREYLIDDNLTIATLSPLPITSNSPRPAMGHGGSHGH